MSKQTTEALEIGLSEETRQKTAQLLAEILADQHVLYIKKRNFHWNLVGGRFHTLHEHFETLYTELAAAIDETAERIRMIGCVPPGSMAEFLELASLKEDKGRLIAGDEAIRSLLEDHETCIRTLRKSAQTIEEEQGDAGTGDFVVELLQKHEMTAWMLRSYLESSSSN